MSMVFSTGLTTFLFCLPGNKADTLPRTWVAVAEQMVKEEMYFAQPQYVEENANHLFSKLKQEAYLVGASANEIPIRLAYYLSEINVLHLFREGNGRAQRMFIEYLAEKMNELMTRITSPAVLTSMSW